MISYQTDIARQIKIDIYDITGKNVATPVNEILQQPGKYTVSQALNTSGMYLVRITAGNETCNKVVLISK